MEETITKNDFQTIVEMTNENQKDKIGNLISKIQNYTNIDCRKNKDQSKITSNQLRGVYDEINKCKTNLDLQLVRPKLAYIAGRQKDAKDIVMFFNDLLKYANDQIIKTKDDSGIIKNIKEFFAALVSYHKYYYKES